MKKIIRVLGVSLSMLAVISCSSNDDVDNSLPETNPSTLSGSYKISIAMVATAVDTNNDGVSNQDLLKEGYNSCEFDDNIEISEKNWSVIRKGSNCEPNEKNEVYQYTYDATTKKLDLYVNGKISETLTGAYIEKDDNVKKLFYQRYDSKLKQTVYIKLINI